MKQLALLLLMVTTLTGCTLPGHLYPVRGPLATRNPVPISTLTLKQTSAGTGIHETGTLTATVPDGEVCNGHWAMVAQDDPTARKMADAWDGVYGPGFFVANVLGSQFFAHAELAGNKGTTLSVEFYNSAPGGTQPSAIKGVATDNNGDLYKLTF